ncbi:4744_t:CDS:2, partial [Funneliformis mosseae]
VRLKDLTIADFKDALSEKEQTKGITEMNIWKSEKLDDNPMLNFSIYYSNADDADDNKKSKDGYLHIFIVLNSLFLSDNMKIPILRHEYNSYLIQSMEDTCISEDLNILFQINDTENAYEFITKTLDSPIWNNSSLRKRT